jgi:hypothetical protein
MTMSDTLTVSMVTPGDDTGAAVVPVCEHCGRTLVTSGRGRPARFCRDACRKAARRASSDHRRSPARLAGTARAVGMSAEPGAVCAPGVPGEAPEFPDTSGLVICAITGRPESPAEVVPALWQPRFPSSELLSVAAEALPAREPWDGAEGPRPRLVISPGAVAVECPDLARRERTVERAENARRKSVDVRAAHLATHPADVQQCDDCPTDPEPSRRIMAWSRKSRANMVRALCELDYAPMFADPTRVPALITLTYSADWEVVAPSGAVCKAHVKALRKRWLRAWGTPLVGPWKLEFQRRGAPHFHLLTVPPHGRALSALDRWGHPAVGAGLTFHAWLSAVWADVTDCPQQSRENHRLHVLAGTGVDFAEGLRATDPKRTAVYFSKHGTFGAKEYQNRVPALWSEPGKGPGRFWGYWGLARRTVAVEVESADQIRAARVIRRWARAQGTTCEVRVPRGVDAATGRLSLRRVRRRVSRLPHGVGWVSVNDGAVFATQLARALTL